MIFWKIIAFLKVSGDFLHFSENPHFCAQKGAHLVILCWKSPFLGFLNFSPFWTIWSILQHLKNFRNKCLMLQTMSWHMFFVVCFLLYFNVVTHVETLDSLESGKKIARIKVFQNYFIHSTAGLSHQFELYLHYFTFPPPGFWSSVYATNVCSVDSTRSVKSLH